ncbi:uncharacterized protein DUF3714 [Flavobacterium croceum DSM 17960]|uniref:Uncharacterized protein DUF3714 n=1 Tax=Flavobacterium croceum DSM 17960 TaxID=1121886 RepID=A0A2S4N581_9FLAO|nr:conjugative transposon protein TraM [Flavobacterium croceum]POS00902.1 uncharacterized protein DUF3714 [Flavobacterium croceum DSM 17960]
MKSINEFLQKNKKLMFIAPIAIVALVFVANAMTPEATKVENKQLLDTSLPSSDSTALSNDKLSTYQELENYKRSQETDQNYNTDLSIEDVSVSSTTSSPTKPNSVYQTSTTNDKLDIMLKKLEKEQASRRRISSKPRETNSSTARDEYVSAEPKIQYVEQSNNIPVKNNNLNSFFKKNKTEVQFDDKILAVIKGDQNVKYGDRITMMLSKDCTINNKTYKANTYLYGFASFRDNRLIIDVSNINNDRMKIVVFDAQDGGEGVYVKNSVVEDANKGVQDEISDDINVSRIPGGNTIKKMFKKKTTEKKVLLLNNYRLILKIY